MPLELYLSYSCPPCRAVLLTLHYLNLTCEEKMLNEFNQDHLTKKFYEINPIQTIPTIVDNEDTIIYDSHAINAYLQHKYGKNEILYPIDPIKRAAVDQMLHYDSSFIFPAFRWVINLIKMQTYQKNEEIVKKQLELVYSMVQGIRKRTGFEGGKVDSGYIAGYHSPSIADFSFCTSLGALDFFVPINKKKFSFVDSYMYRCNFEIEKFHEYNENGNRLLMRRINERYNVTIPGREALLKK